MNNEKTHKTMALFDTLFHKVMNKMKRIEQKPRDFGTKHMLYPSEIHTIEVLGRHPGINGTELAAQQGVTRGAVSQVIRKLESKGMIIKMKSVSSDREVFLKLSPEGQVAFRNHEDFHSRVYPTLVEVVEDATPDQVAYLEKLFKAIDTFCDKVLDEDA